ncbi:flagellin [Stenotrophomonas pictorum JCM 9942]|uniref:Flagellin n=1 Tax=Stenotrophomonas pictorum JCM 9942 TaxID=1236960 RepID=A0A0R0A2N3_9GAMM|nr:flagellin [Stenotrophomonas pictorum]KRG39468.1 flagellin [Stenotrophomonas pictorum JCM 9942]
MSQVINTNIMSLNAQRNLNTSGASLATSIQRLSSGLRINSAKDDAAGLAISERFTTQIRGLDVAVRNANDGISLAQTAEGAMVEIGSNLQRIRELAVQSSNATNSSSDRKALDAEVKQLVAEIDRVARQTNFNGTTLLDGTFAGALFQVGADAGQTIGINALVDANADALGTSFFADNYVGDAASTLSPAAAAGTLTGLTITVTNDGNATPVTIGDVDYAMGATAKEMGNAIAQAINAKLDQTGIYAEADKDGVLTLSSLKGGQTFTVTGGTNTLAEYGLVEDAAPGGGGVLSATATAAKDLDVNDFVGAQRAIDVIDTALTAVSSARAEMGAIQNRFTSTIANLQTTSENLSASRSRIRDTDYAKETAELTRTQILQQAGTAMLAQANTSTQNVLSLLQQ